ncbi:hypothetical protein BST81_04150 [Leptolyngbya sp. 'hensonii']|nr:hypothetical protein BST81_04150 [Leptolyngbya sp. 'hensonii']
MLAIVAAVLVNLQASAACAASSRPAWVEAEIYRFNHSFASQLPDDLATKMEKMSATPFAFYRGTAHIFYQDMKTLPASNFVNSATSSAWLQGDLHPQNMGTFQDSQGHEVFNTTDFDEGYLGPYVWDLRRMAVGILLLAQEQKVGLDDRKEVVTQFLDAYLDQMEDFKGSQEELSYRLDADNTSSLVQDFIQKSKKQSRSKFLDKYTTIDQTGARVFQTSAALQPVPQQTSASLAKSMGDYIASIAKDKRQNGSYYKLKDIRLKLGSGTGSLGRYRYLLLIEGPSTDKDDDRILEMKQEVASAVAIAAPGRFPASAYDNHEGRRVAMTMKAMLTHTDALLGYTMVNGMPFMIREKSPSAVDFDYTLLTSKSKFLDTATDQGKVLATNHALADKDYDATIVPVSIDKEVTDLVAGKRSQFKQEILSFAMDYATQVENDYKSFVDAYQRGVPLY